MSSVRKIAAAVYVVEALRQEKRKYGEVAAKKRPIWVREWLQMRPSDGAHNKQMQEFRAVEDQKFLFKNFLRMDESIFDELLALVAPVIAKKDTNMRLAIPPSERLAITLRFLATGDSYASLAFLFRVAHNTISVIVPEVCDAIYQVLKDQYMMVPSTQEQWSVVAKKFDDVWNFPHCIGAVDGKHVVMVAPPNSGSNYYNYKSSHSIVLMGVADAQYKFLYIDVGCNGRVSDGGVFYKSSLAAAINYNALNLPDPSPLRGRNTLVPFCLVADAAFALAENIMKPYPGRALNATQGIFNYRLSRARRVVENAFGILSARFRVLRHSVLLDANKTKRVALACCALHNFLIEKSASYVTPTLVGRYDDAGRLIPGEWRKQGSMEEAHAEEHNFNMTAKAKAIREELSEYFISVDGEVPWQYQQII